MKNDIKLAVKSLGYAYNKDQVMVSTVIFALVGIGMLIFGGSDLGVHGGYFLGVTGMFPVQMLSSLSASNLVLSSAVRKKMQTSLPAMLCCGTMLLGYFVAVLVLGVKIWLNPEIYGSACVTLLSSAAAMAGLMLYVALAYKYFVCSTLLFVVIFVVMMNMWSFGGLQQMLLSYGEKLQLAYGAAALLGLAIVLAGGCLEYLISLLVYKAPLSKQAQTPSLRKEM